MASSSFAQSPPTAATTAPTKTPLNATPPTSVIYNHHPYNHTHSHLLSTANASGSSANSSANGSTKPYYYHQMMTNSSNSSSASSSTSSSSSGKTNTLDSLFNSSIALVVEHNTILCNKYSFYLPFNQHIFRYLTNL